MLDPITAIPGRSSLGPGSSLLRRMEISAGSEDQPYTVPMWMGVSLQLTIHFTLLVIPTRSGCPMDRSQGTNQSRRNGNFHPICRWKVTSLLPTQLPQRLRYIPPLTASTSIGRAEHAAHGVCQREGRGLPAGREPEPALERGTGPELAE